MEFTRQPGFRASSTLIATLGDHICLDRSVWTGAPGGAAFEETALRFAAGGFARAVAERDWDGARAHFADDAVISDHRSLRFGAVMGELGPDAYRDSLSALAELAPDMQSDVHQLLAWNRRGVEDADAALARFEELCGEGTWSGSDRASAESRDGGKGSVVAIAVQNLEVVAQGTRGDQAIDRRAHGTPGASRSPVESDGFQNCALGKRRFDDRERQHRVTRQPVGALICEALEHLLDHG